VKAMKKTFKKVVGTCSHKPHIVSTFSVIALLLGVVIGMIFVGGKFEVMGRAFGTKVVAQEQICTDLNTALAELNVNINAKETDLATANGDVARLLSEQNVLSQKLTAIPAGIQVQETNLNRAICAGAILTQSSTKFGSKYSQQKLSASCKAMQSEIQKAYSAESIQLSNMRTTELSKLLSEYTTLTKTLATKAQITYKYKIPSLETMWSDIQSKTKSKGILYTELLALKKAYQDKKSAIELKFKNDAATLLKKYQDTSAPTNEITRLKNEQTTINNQLTALKTSIATAQQTVTTLSSELNALLTQKSEQEINVKDCFDELAVLKNADLAEQAALAEQAEQQRLAAEQEATAALEAERAAANEACQQTPEVCNGVDDNCDGQIDEKVKLTFYADGDNDGFGNVALNTQACTAPAGYVASSTDCDDAKPAVNPGMNEVCGNNLDDDCAGGDAACAPVCTPTTEICGDGIDQDCINGDLACTSTTNAAGCTDSDGGNSIYARGTLSNPQYPWWESSKTDTCWTNTPWTDGSSIGISSQFPLNAVVLSEFSCREDGGYETRNQTCPNGCQNGACLP